MDFAFSKERRKELWSPCADVPFIGTKKKSHGRIKPSIRYSPFSFSPLSRIRSWNSMGEPTPTLSAHLEVVFRHLASPVVKKAVPFLGCENAVTKVRRMLLRIQAVLSDAEERQEKDEAVRSWLCDLKGVICDADDVFDELTTRVLQLRADSAVCDSVPVLAKDLLSFDFSTKINGIGEKLDEIVKGGVGLHLNEVVGVNRAAVVKEGKVGSVPGVLVDESCVFGREGDKENVVRQLLESESRRSDFDVVPVVGKGGLGKTTLARLVFHDERIDTHFRLRIWVSVSEDCDARRLTKAIIESATGDKYLLLGLDAMQRNLRTILGAKRFLIVLDDVQSGSCNEWEKLQIPLMSGAKGSKVLITTSSEMVAKVMGSLPPYHLKGLSFEECWSLFSLHAFGDGNINADPDVVMIGKELVKRCKGLPLAVKALASLMHTRKDEYEWRHILKNQIWNFPIKNKVFFPSLWLSYIHLPMHLKQCFMYCCMLPKDIKFGKQLLIRLWMAQGFIVPKENVRMEDLGGQYFADLLWRSFFQYSHFDYEDGEPKYVMHEVVHDFARFISAGECFLMHFADSYGLSKSTLHFSLNSSKLESLTLEVFNESQGLRTFSLAGECKLHEWKVPADLFLKLSCLRVLDLSNTSLHVVPESIGHLIHLRYLSLSNTQIERLPESLCGLYNLQTLNLGDCFGLKELPKGIRCLINLRHLNLQLHQCRITGLSSFPPGIGQLTSLQTLTTFVVGSMDGCKIEELKDLVDLQGELCISKLDNVVNEDEAKEADLKKKQHIYKLEFQWNLGTKVEGDVHEKVLNNLQPHANLKELAIRGFGGVMLPSWLGDPAFSNLVTLNLSDCSECRLPPLGQLLSLKYLSLEKVGVKHIHKDFCGKGKFTCFPSLEMLKFENLLQLEEWSGVGEGDMPRLEELSLVGCSKLKILPRTISALKKLEIWNCFCLKSLPKLPSLNSLVLRCPTHTLLEGLHELTSLLHLEIKNCPELTSLPRNLTNLSSLKDLIINDCKQLNLLVGLKNLTSLEYLEFSGCPQLQSFSEGLPAALQFLSICTCPSLSQWCQTIGIEHCSMTAHNFSVCIDGEKVSIY